MTLRNLVKVKLVCRNCGDTRDWCVRIDRNVPEPLQCPPGGGTGTVSISCTRCGRVCFRDFREFERAVESETSGGWGRHIKQGAVVVSC